MKPNQKWAEWLPKQESTYCFSWGWCRESFVDEDDDECEPEVGKVNLKSNVDEALNDELLLKSNGDEALNDGFP